MEQINCQLQDVQQARADDAERSKRAEMERRAYMEDEKAERDRAERKARCRLEEEQERRQADKARLEEELRISREDALKRKDEEVRRQMEWLNESREMKWKAECRELEWKSEVKQVEWQMDWQKARLVEESELLRPAEPLVSERRPRSQSRVREELFNAVAAAQGDISDIGPLIPGRRQGNARKAPAFYPGTDQRARPSSAAAVVTARRYKDKWEEAEDVIERLVDHAVPGLVSAGLGYGADVYTEAPRPQTSKRPGGYGSARNSRNSSRPSSANPVSSRRSLAEEVAADLDGFPTSDCSPQESTSDQYNAPAPRKVGKSSSSSAMTYRQAACHSAKWFDQQRSKQRGQKGAATLSESHACACGSVFAPGSKFCQNCGSRREDTMPLDQVRRAYPEVSAILAAGAH